MKKLKRSGLLEYREVMPIYGESIFEPEQYLYELGMPKMQLTHFLINRP